MIKLMPATMSAKLTLRKRNKKFNQTRKDAIKAIKNAINNGKYSTIIYYWTVEELESFWHYFSDKGYKLSIAGIYDFTKASEFFITHDYLDITISWGDAS